MKYLKIVIVPILFLGFSSGAFAANYCGSSAGGEAINDMKRTSMKLHGDYNYYSGWSHKKGTFTKYLGAGRKTSQWSSGVWGGRYEMCDVDFYWRPWKQSWNDKVKVSWRTGKCWGEYPNRTCKVI